MGYITASTNVRSYQTHHRWHCEPGNEYRQSAAMSCGWGVKTTMTDRPPHSSPLWHHNSTPQPSMPVSAVKFIVNDCHFADGNLNFIKACDETRNELLLVWDVGSFPRRLLCCHYFGRPFVKRFALCYRTVVCLSVLSVCLSVTLVYCGQTVGWIKIILGMEAWPRPGHIVLHVDPVSPAKEAQPPIFGACLLWPNDWMDQNATWYGSRPRSWRHCFRWGS